MCSMIDSNVPTAAELPIQLKRKNFTADYCLVDRRLSEAEYRGLCNSLYLDATSLVDARHRATG